MIWRKKGEFDSLFQSLTRRRRTPKKFGKSPSFQRKLFCVDSHKKRLTACVPHGIISTCVGMSIWEKICHTVRRASAVTPDLSTCRKVAGIKQTMRALRGHGAEKRISACDADPAVHCADRSATHAKRTSRSTDRPRWRSLATARASPWAAAVAVVQVMAGDILPISVKNIYHII